MNRKVRLNKDTLKSPYRVVNKRNIYKVVLAIYCIETGSFID